MKKSQINTVDNDTNQDTSRVISILMDRELRKGVGKEVLSDIPESTRCS